MQNRFLLSLALLALGILVLVCACRHDGPRIEADLQQRADAALAGLDGLDGLTQAGLTPTVNARVDGRDLLLTGSVQDEQTRQRLVEAFDGVHGLRRVDDRLTVGGVGQVPGSPADAASTGAANADGTNTDVAGSAAGSGLVSSPASQPQAGVSMAAQDDGRWLLQGRVADDAQRQAWLDAAQGTFGSDRVVDRLEIDPFVGSGDGEAEDGSSSDSSGSSGSTQGLDAISPTAWVTALAAGPSDAALYPGDHSVRVEGSVPDEPSATRFLNAVGQAVPEDWRIEDALERVGAADAAAVQQALIDTLEVRNIEFESNSSSITPAGQQVVLRVAQALRSAPQLAVDIEGHTDASGNADWNRTLSQQRAQAVVEALQALGIDASRLSSQGFGSDRPIADNSTPEGRRANRRIEFKVLEPAVLGGTR